MTRKRLLAVVPKPVGISPGQRYRIEQWERYLEDELAIEYAVFESPALTDALYARGRTAEKAVWTAYDFVRRALVVPRASAYDVVLVYREAAMLGPALYERLIGMTGVPFVYDFDDAIWLPGVGSRNPLLARLRFPSKTSEICRAAALVTVGNRHLADYAAQFNAHVEVVPTTIDLAQYPVIDEPQLDDELIIGWTGSFSTLVQLEHVRAAIEQLGVRRRVALRVICSEPPARPFENVRNEFVPWRAEDEAAEVAACHVGIMPLPDDAFARGKCGCKALQFMATGRPVVVSPVGVNADIVRDDENGNLASCTEQWIDCLDRLAQDSALRARLGRAARKTVETSYSAGAAARRFGDVLSGVVH